jgi:hypothetical protein
VVAFDGGVTYGRPVPGDHEWALLMYRLPREPSTPRISVWRRLRRLGVAQLLDGVVALPADARTREQLEWVAAEVLDAGGEATVWTGRVESARRERDIVAAMSAAVAADYRAVVEAAGIALGVADGDRRRALARLRRELHRIGDRDHFPPPERDLARRAVDALALSFVDA